MKRLTIFLIILCVSSSLHTLIHASSGRFANLLEQSQQNTLDSDSLFQKIADEWALVDATTTAIVSPIQWYRVCTLLSLYGLEDPSKLTTFLADQKFEATASQRSMHAISYALFLSYIDKPERLTRILDKLEIPTKTAFFSIAFQHFTNQKSCKIPLDLQQACETYPEIKEIYLSYRLQHHPDQVLKEIESLESPLRERMFLNAFYQLSHSDEAKALDLLLQKKVVFEQSGVERYYVARHIRSLAKDEPLEARKLLMQYQKSVEYDSLFDAYVRELAENNPQLAMSEIDAEKLSTNDRRRYKFQVYRTWKQTDPSALTEYVLELPYSEIRASEYVLFKNWPKGAEEQHAEFTQAVTLKFATHYGVELNQHPLFKSLSNWAHVDLTAATDWVENSVASELKDIALAGMIQKQVGGNFEETQNLYLAISSSLIRKQLAEEIAYKLADLSPEDGLKWIPFAGEEFDTTKMAQRFIIHWAYNDVTGAMNNFPHDQSIETQRSLAYWIGRGFHQISPETATDWLKTLPTEISARASWFYPQAFSHIAPELVINFFQEHPSLKKNGAAHNKFFEVYADYDQQGATDLLSKLNKTGQRSGINAIAKNILQHDTDAFSPWLSDLDSSLQDFARKAFVDSKLSRDPVKAFEYATEIASKYKWKKKTLSKAITELIEYDSILAYEIIFSNTRLNAEERSEALTKFD